MKLIKNCLFFGIASITLTMNLIAMDPPKPPKLTPTSTTPKSSALKRTGTGSAASSPSYAAVVAGSPITQPANPPSLTRAVEQSMPSIPTQLKHAAGSGATTPIAAIQGKTKGSSELSALTPTKFTAMPKTTFGSAASSPSTAAHTPSQIGSFMSNYSSAAGTPLSVGNNPSSLLPSPTGSLMAVPTAIFRQYSPSQIEQLRKALSDLPHFHGPIIPLIIEYIVPALTIEQMGNLKSEDDSPITLVAMIDNDRFASYNNGTLKLWDIRGKTVERKGTIPQDFEVQILLFDPSQNALITSNYTLGTRAFSLDKKQGLIPKRHDADAATLGFIGNGKNGTIVKRQTNQDKPPFLKRRKKRKNRPGDISLSTKLFVGPKARVATINKKEFILYNRLMIYRLNMQGQLLKQISAQYTAYLSLAVLDKNYIAVGVRVLYGTGGQEAFFVDFINVRTGETEDSFPQRYSPDAVAALSNQRCASACNNIIHVWSRTIDRPMDLTGHEARVTGLLSPTPQRLISFDEKGTIMVWRVNDSTYKRLLVMSANNYASVASNPNTVEVAPVVKVVNAHNPHDDLKVVKSVSHEDTHHGTATLNPNATAIAMQLAHANCCRQTFDDTGNEASLPPPTGYANQPTTAAAYNPYAFAAMLDHAASTSVVTVGPNDDWRYVRISDAQSATSSTNPHATTAYGSNTAAYDPHATADGSKK